MAPVDPLTRPSFTRGRCATKAPRPAFPLSHLILPQELLCYKNCPLHHFPIGPSSFPKSCCATKTAVCPAFPSFNFLPHSSQFGRYKPCMRLYLVRHGQTAWNAEER